MLKAAYFVIVLAIFIDSINAGSASVGRGASAPWLSGMRGGRTDVKKPFDPYDVDSPVMGRNRLGNPLVPQIQRIRPRRNRKTVAMRALVRENHVSASDFIYPLFIQENTQGKVSSSTGKKEPIPSMPGIYCHDLTSMMQEIDESVGVGIKAIALFPRVPQHLKNNMGTEAYNPDGLVPRAVKMIKSKYPDIIVVTDVALDPYSSMGHDGVVEDGKILNDITVQQLQKQAVMQARAGADMVAPSDMMDGRVGAIRDALDSEGFTDVSIMSYSAKYASAFYGPFRDALGSHPGFGDKKTYQMDPGNVREAETEGLLDVAEGADILMVKPGMPYLDVIEKLHKTTNVPIAAYQVSGEYAMLKAASQKGWLNEKESVMESMTCFKRAGADLIFSYYAKQCAQWLKDGK